MFLFVIYNLTNLLGMHELRFKESENGVIDISVDRLVVHITLFTTGCRGQAGRPRWYSDGSASIGTNYFKGQVIGCNPGQGVPRDTVVDGVVELVQRGGGGSRKLQAGRRWSSWRGAVGG